MCKGEYTRAGMIKTACMFFRLGMTKQPNSVLFNQTARKKTAASKKQQQRSVFTVVGFRMESRSQLLFVRSDMNQII